MQQRFLWTLSNNPLAHTEVHAAYLPEQHNPPAQQGRLDFPGQQSTAQPASAQEQVKERARGGAQNYTQNPYL